MKNKIAKFFYKLGYSLSCGVPLISGLSRLAQDLESELWKSEVEKIAEGIKDGMSFTQALHERVAMDIDEGLLAIIDAGEKSGMLDVNLQKAAESIEKGLFQIHFNPEKVQASRVENSSQLWKEVVESAVEKKASVIHFCPELESVSVRFRIDGSLQTIEELSFGAYRELLTQFKIASALDVGERSLPQDGRIKDRFQNRELDLRVATMPCVSEEKLTIRILDYERVVLDPSRVFPDQNDRKSFEEIINVPFGMVLICGPTGSGKTTTAYTALSELAKTSQRSIHTVEDPVEYMLPGVSHMQIKPRIGLTAIAALKTLMRHDTDVVYLSEVRDPETLEMCVKIAITGHLFISCLHTANVAQTLSRLMTIDGDKTLLTSALSGILCQQLVRVICEHCKTQSNVESEFKEQGITQHFEGKGCEHCNHTGYRGRRAVYEFLKFNRELKDKIRNCSSIDLNHILEEVGHQGIEKRVLEYVKQGITTISECKRVMESL